MARSMRVVLVGLLGVLLQSHGVTALSCTECNYNTTCPCLPDFCDKGLRPCGCCYECRGKVGDACSGMLVPCESGLMCVNSKGVALPRMYWYDFTFHGTCQKVASCQVIDNYTPYDFGPHETVPQ